MDEAAPQDLLPDVGERIIVALGGKTGGILHGSYGSSAVSALSTFKVGNLMDAI
jgi:hypothetical protein